MREILFRGKRVDNGEWVEGYYSPVRLPIFGEMGHFINENGYRAIEVKKETVGQYTGLTDKNGKRIFEGDIVRFDYVNDDGNDAHEDFLIIFANGAFRAQYLGNIKCAPNTLYDEIGTDKCEVIGTIYDNPELLEE